MPRPTSRRRVLLAPLFGVLMLSACSDEPAPRTSFPPLTYSYLPVIRLSVASLQVENRATVVANDFSPQSPVLPTDALMRMANDRLQASGNSGRAVFVIDQASLVRTDTGLVGNFAVHIDVQSSDAQHVAYAAAKVTRTYAGEITDLRGTLYDMTKQMMDDMNVELEYQLHRTLADWVQSVSTGQSVAPVQSQSLNSTTTTTTTTAAPYDATPAPAPTPVPLQSNQTIP